MTYSEVQKRFANKQFGRKGYLKSGNVSCDTERYYSYYTVFAVWADKEKNVCLVYNEKTTSSSSRHRMWESDFPADVTVIPFSDKYLTVARKYHGCDIFGHAKQWEKGDRFYVMHYLVREMQSQFDRIKACRVKGAENIDTSFLESAEKIVRLYDDTTWTQFYKTTIDKDCIKFCRHLRYGFQHFKDMEFVRYVADATYGKGTLEKYWNYSARFRKNERDRRLGEALKSRLGISRYAMGWRDALKLSAKERIGYLMRKNEAPSGYFSQEESDKRFQSWATWLTQFGLRFTSMYHRADVCPTLTEDGKMIGMIHGYDSESWHNVFKMSKRLSEWEYCDFKNAADKAAWVKKWRDEIKEMAINHRACQILAEKGERVGTFRDGSKSYNILNLNAWRKAALSPSDFNAVSDFCKRRDKYIHDQRTAERNKKRLSAQFKG